MTETEIGEVNVIHKNRECDVKWKIPDFVNLSQEVDACYGSPEFAFEGEYWRMVMYPNGREDSDSAGYIDLGLYRAFSSTPAIDVEFIFAVKTAKGYKYLKRWSTGVFEGNSWHYIDRLLGRSDFEKRKSEFLDSECFTVACKVKRLTANAGNEAAAGCSQIKRSLERDVLSPRKKKRVNEPIKCPQCSTVIEDNMSTTYERYEKLSSALEEMLLSGDHSDVTLKVKGEEFGLHKNILAARSSFFSSIFKNNAKENIKGVASVDDCEPNIFRSFIHFLYTGKVDTLSNENVCDLYKMADKHRENHLKEECLQFMMKNFCVDTFCEVSRLALSHEESGLLGKASEFFCKNVKEVIRSEKWETFLRGHPTQANEFYKGAAEYFVAQ